MFYEEFDPAPRLTAHVASYWTMTVAPTVPPGFPHRVYPDGCVSLSVAVRGAGGGAGLVGPRSRAFEVPVFPGDRFWGVRFWPDAGGTVLGTPARALGGTLTQAAAVLGTERAQVLYQALRPCRERDEARAALDRVLAPWVEAAPALDPVVRAAVIALIASRGETPVAELARELGLSPRQLQRRFGDAVGLAPKRFARIRRLRSALSEALSTGPRTWSSVAADLGYADQSHLVREFAELAGRTPEAVAAGIRSITHGRVTP